MQQELVIDTNVLLSDGNALKKFGASKINIPFIVLQELDSHKTDPGDTGVNARTTIKFLDQLRQQGNLKTGVSTSEGSVIRIVPNGNPTFGDTPDDKIIGCAQTLATQSNLPVKIISNDINLRVKASFFDLVSDGHNGNNVHIDESSIFTGISKIEIDSDLIDTFHAEGNLYLEKAKALHINEFVLLKSKTNPKHTAVGRVAADGEIWRIVNRKDVFGIRSKNLEQACALDLLLDVDLPLVTLMGPAGTGKTLVALAAALDLVLNQKQYEKVIIMRPPIPMGKDIGYLPGTLEEKLTVWMGPIFDNFEMLIGEQTKCSFDYLVGSGKIEVMPPTFIRGRSISNSILLVDESQSLTIHEAKTIVTRMHESSKLIMTGDIRQIDNPRLSALDNGLTRIVDSFKPYEEAGHISLSKCERSSLATLAAEIL